MHVCSRDMRSTHGVPCVSCSGVPCPIVLVVVSERVSECRMVGDDLSKVRGITTFIFVKFGRVVCVSVQQWNDKTRCERLPVYSEKCERDGWRCRGRT